MIKNVILYCLLIALTALYACNKNNEGFNPVGGDLPTNYITIKDSSFVPSTITVANGSSFTFLNGTTNVHTLLSDDSILIHSGHIAPDSFYFVKPDTNVNPAAQITIQYHCVEHPSARGTIILNP